MYNITVNENRESPNFKQMFADLKSRFNYVNLIEEYPEVPWFPENDEDLKNGIKSIFSQWEQS